MAEIPKHRENLALCYSGDIGWAAGRTTSLCRARRIMADGTESNWMRRRKRRTGSRKSLENRQRGNYADGEGEKRRQGKPGAWSSEKVSADLADDMMATSRCVMVDGRGALPSWVSVYTLWYNCCRIRQTLRVTPAMEAGLGSASSDPGAYRSGTFDQLKNIGANTSLCRVPPTNH